MYRAFSRNGLSLQPRRHRQRSRRHRRERTKGVISLRELRLFAGKTQADVATALEIKQPSVSKIEKQGDMHLSTLRAYVQAIGGELELVVKFPK